MASRSDQTLSGQRQDSGPQSVFTHPHAAPLRLFSLLLYPPGLKGGFFSTTCVSVSLFFSILTPTPTLRSNLNTPSPFPIPPKLTAFPFLPLADFKITKNFLLDKYLYGYNTKQLIQQEIRDVLTKLAVYLILLGNSLSQKKNRSLDRMTDKTLLFKLKLDFLTGSELKNKALLYKDDTRQGSELFGSVFF